MDSALAPTPTVSLPVPRSTLHAGLLLATLGFLWFMLCRNLSLEWSSNEQYNYGWFVPFFAVFLFWLRWEDWGKAENGQLKAETSNISVQRPETNASSSAFSLESPVVASQPLRQLSAFAFALLLLLPVRLFEVANPDWRPLSWIHAIAVVGLTLIVICYWRGKRALRHFAFPVCFILVAVPWVTPIEGPIVQGLMRLVAAVATETLTLFGIPAQLEGSLIRVSNGVVGVSEACSGVRSLQTSLMIGLLFGELKRLTIARRVLLVVAALAIALVANFARAFFLFWIAATENLAAVERWHDIAGYAIVGAVFLGTLAGAAWLARGKKSAGRNQQQAVNSEARSPSSDLRPPPSTLRLPPSSLILLTFLYLLLVEVAIEGWYRWHERNLVPTTSWSVRWPEDAPGLHDLTIDEHTREMLRFDVGREVSWPLHLRDGNDLSSATDSPAVAFLYYFRWEPGTATVLRARAHRPDICLPATGWTQIGAPAYRTYLVSDSFALPFRLFRFQRETAEGRMIYADTFFCLREDRTRAEAADNQTTPVSNWSILERWEAVREGLRNPGQQVLEFALISTRDRSKTEAEADFAKLIPVLIQKAETLKR